MERKINFPAKIWRTGNGFVIGVPSNIRKRFNLQTEKFYDIEINIPESQSEPVNAGDGMSSRDLSFMTCAAVA